MCDQQVRGHGLEGDPAPLGRIAMDGSTSRRVLPMIPITCSTYGALGKTHGFSLVVPTEMNSSENNLIRRFRNGATLRLLDPYVTSASASTIENQEHKVGVENDQDLFFFFLPFYAIRAHISPILSPSETRHVELDCEATSTLNPYSSPSLSRMRRYRHTFTFIHSSVMNTWA